MYNCVQLCLGVSRDNCVLSLGMQTETFLGLLLAVLCL